MRSSMSESTKDETGTTSVFAEIFEEVGDLGKEALEDDVETHRDRPGAADQPAKTPASDSVIDKEFGDAAPIDEPIMPKLSSARDPITGTAVSPPPYVQVMEVIDSLMDGGPGNTFPRPLNDEEILSLRFLGYYFPRRLHLCGTKEGRQTILRIGIVRTSIAFTLLILSIWQAVDLIVGTGTVYGIYLMLLNVLVFSVFFAYQLLFRKGWRALDKVGNSENLTGALIKVSQILQENERKLMLSIDNPTRENIKENLLNSDESSSGANVPVNNTASLFSLNEKDMVIKNSYAVVGFVLVFTVSIILIYTVK